MTVLGKSAGYIMSPHPENSSNASLAPMEPHSDFKWMSKLARMQGLSCLILNNALDIVYYDRSLIKLLELSDHIKREGISVLDVIEGMAKRGDFGPGDPTVFRQLLENEILRPANTTEALTRKLDLLTPSGRRLEFNLDLQTQDHYLLSCRDMTTEYIDKHALQVALNSSRSGYVIYNLESGKYHLCGESPKSALGEHLTERLLNKGLHDIVHPDDFKNCVKVWQGSLKEKKGCQVTFRVIDENTRIRWVKCHATPQVSESGTIANYIMFYTDVTSQLRVQDELRQAIDKAEKALSAKNNFLGRLSHEIRTPMNAVVGIADALIHHNADPTLSSKLELIQTSAEKIIRIVDESLQHTKLEEDMLELDPQPASPADSVRNVCALWAEKSAKHDVKLICRIDNSVPERMIFDDHRYEQCLNNLISNAVKFSPGGKIQVVLTSLETKNGPRLVLAVKDTGIGMSEAQLESLFEAYTQADKSISQRFGGTGLGMNITKQIIELMGGTVSARSELGKGTVIILTLPVNTERRIEDRRENSQALVSDMLSQAVPKPTAYDNLRILVVDDNATNHIVIKSLLETLVDSVDTAENGKDAINKLEQNEYDAVLMDIHMPVMDGIEATLAIRGTNSDFADIPIIALTADPQYQQKRLCKNIGMDDALAKPVKLTEILNSFDKLLPSIENAQEAA